MKISNPIYIYRKIVDEDSYEFPSEIYQERELLYIEKLKEKLSQNCAVSFFLPIECSTYIRVCESIPRKAMWVVDSKDLRGKDAKFCIEKYTLICTTTSDFIEQFNLLNNEKKENKFIIPENLKIKSVKITTKMIFNILDNLQIQFQTFQTNLVKNINLKRIFFDNLNHRFQNDMSLINLNGFQTIFDCFETVILEFYDEKLNKKDFTGIEDIDLILKGMNSEQSLKFEKVEKSTFLASAGISLFQLWALFNYDGISSNIEFEYGVNFDEGLLNQIKDYFFDESFYLNTIVSTFQDIQNEDSSGIMKSIILDQNKISKISKLIVMNLKELVLNYKEEMIEIRQILNNMDKEIGYSEGLKQNERSVKLNEGFSLMTIEALEDLNHIQPDFGVALNLYKKFMLKNSIRVQYSPDSIVFKTHSTYTSSVENTCQSNMVKINYYLSQALLNFYQNYDNSAINNNGTPNENYNQKHFNALKNLAIFLQKSIFTVKCSFKGINFSKNIFLSEFEKNGYSNYKFPTMSLLTNPKMPYLDPKYKKNGELSDFIFNMMLLDKYHLANIMINLKFNNDIQSYFKNLMIAEKNYLSQMKGYEIGNKQKIIGVLSKTFSYIMITSLITLEVNEAIIKEANPKKFQKEKKSLIFKSIKKKKFK